MGMLPHRQARAPVRGLTLRASAGRDLPDPCRHAAAYGSNPSLP